MWWTPDRQAYAVNYLIGNGGLSPVGAAGLVSRWVNVESSGGPASVNPYSGAFGIGQWLGARLAPIRGNTDFDSQLSYAIEELNGSEYRAGQILRSATTADQAAVGASTYERAEGYNSGTGRDNFTNRTAAGVADVLAYSGNAGGSDSSYTPIADNGGIDYSPAASGNYDEPAGDYYGLGDLATASSTIGIGAVVIVAAALLLALLISE